MRCLPRLKEGGLSGGFWAIYTPQGKLNASKYEAAYQSAILKQKAIHELAKRFPEDVEIAYSAKEAERIHKERKIIIFQSMENSYPFGKDLSKLKKFYLNGVRMLGVVHARNNQFADSSTDHEKLHGGISDLGEKLILEANRLGVIVDASHASDRSLRDILGVSQTSIILSHSGVDSVYKHPRNVSDELIIELASNGGVLHVNSVGIFLENLMPSQRSSFDKYFEHLLYVLKLVGPDHVGIGADWDGGGGVDGMKDVASVSKITQELLKAGYSFEDVTKIWGGNLMRVMREVEAFKETYHA